MPGEIETACHEQTLLLKQSNDAALRLSAATSRLAAQMGRLPRDEYNQLRTSVDQAQLDAETASLAYARHCKEHGC